MKKWLSLALAMMFASGGVSAQAVAANDDAPVYDAPVSSPAQEAPQQVNEEAEPISEEVETTNYIKVTGTIVDFEERYDSPALVVETSPDMISIFPLTEDVELLFDRKGNPIDRDDFEVGMEVELYYDRHMAILMIYPAVIVPDIVIAGDKKDGSVRVEKFDDNLLSLEGDLVLRINDETEIVNEKGEEVDVEAAKGQELIVFYDIVMESYPMQTFPTKIVVLPPHEHDAGQGNGNEGKEDEGREMERPEVGDDRLAKVKSIIDEDHYMKGDTKMIPLRKVTETLGYTVTWDSSTQTATARLANSAFLITIGEESYGYNRSLRQFDVAPQLKKGTTYVSEDILEILFAE